MNRTEIASLLEQLANGIDPETGQRETGCRILESTRVVRALFNAAAMLREMPLTEASADTPPTEVKFYRTKGAFGCFSNFSKHPFVLEGREWPTSEHYFQAQKFAGTPSEEEIRLAPTPSEAARMGRQRKRPLRTDWEAVKETVMYAALEAKFSQHPEIRRQLLATGEARIVEHTRNDTYWADGGDGSGRNRLGELLMRLRKSLSET
jgi:N-glycosidase YbiA